MIAASLNAITSELIILAGACAVLFVGLSARNRTLANFTAQLAVLGALFIQITQLDFGNEVFAFNRFFIADGVSGVVKICLCIFTGLVFLYVKPQIKQHELPAGEYYALCLFALLGMMLMTSAAHMLSLYLSLELLSLSLYPLVALQRDDRICSEAAMKYFVLGAIASGILLYGISLLYGLTGTLYLDELQERLIYLLVSGDVTMVAAIVFVVLALAFKLGAAPFHLWLPDVYQGAPYAVILFIASVTKLAAFVMTYRLLVDGTFSLFLQWRPMLIALAVISLVLGNLAAIMQTNIRRMLAYSAIAHVGFIVLGFVAGTVDGLGASLFYTIAYVLMGVGAFAILASISVEGREVVSVDDLKGLAATQPWLAFFMLVFMFSMAGVPLTIGFYAKFSVLQALLDSDYVILAIIAVITTVIGAFYYLRVVKVMYFDTNEVAYAHQSSLSGPAMGALSLNSAVVVVLFLFPQRLIEICQRAFI